MGSQLRSGDVTTATDSITQYALYSELRANGELDKAAAVLKEIEDYNQYDCRSTRELRNWLLMRAFESGVTPIGAQPVSDGGAIEEADALAVKLEEFAGVAASPDRTPEQTAVALVSAARGYHRREDKPFWWAHFNRLNYPVDEWSDETDVFIVDQAKVAVDWHQAASSAQASAAHTADRRTGSRRDQRRIRGLRALRSAGPVRVDRQPRSARDGPGPGHGGQRSERADRGDRARANSARRQHFSRAAVRPDARRADRHQAAARGHRSGGGRRRGGAAATPPHRGGRHPAPPAGPGLAAARTFPEAATRSTTSPPPCSTWIRRTSRCTDRPEPARPTPPRT